MRDLTVTLVQSALAWHDPPTNRRHFAAVLAALDPVPDLVVLPEMFTTGFTMDTATQAEAMDGPTVGWMADRARSLGCTLCGSLVIRDEGECYNRLVWMPPTGVPAWYDKRHLFRMAGEHEHFTPGRARQVFLLDGWRICPLICYDLRFPVWSRGANAFDLLLYVANWPTARRSAWQALLPARAVENQCYVAGVNRTGTDGRNIAYAGDSSAWDYLGQPLADLQSAPGTATVRLDGAALLRYREKFPAWQDADDFDIRY